VQFRHVEQLKSVAELLKEVCMLPPHSDLVVGVLVQDQQFGHELLVDDLLLVLW